MEEGPPRVVGLDLSLTATGVADERGRLSTITTKPEKPLAWRLFFISEQAHQAGYNADLFVVEDLPPARANATAMLGKLHGAFLTEVYCPDGTGTPIAFVPPASLKKYATGKGNATKPDMRMALYQRAGIDERDDNRVDAAWLRYMALDAYGFPAFPVPQTHRIALQKIKWPVLNGYDLGEN